jgi:hypothetical protein
VPQESHKKIWKQINDNREEEQQMTRKKPSASRSVLIPSIMDHAGSSLNLFMTKPKDMQQKLSQVRQFVKAR